MHPNKASRESGLRECAVLNNEPNTDVGTVLRGRERVKRARLTVDTERKVRVDKATSIPGRSPRTSQLGADAVFFVSQLSAAGDTLVSGVCW